LRSLPGDADQGSMRGRATTEGKFSEPYEYRWENNGMRTSFNRSLMLFLNEPVTSPAVNTVEALRGRIPLASNRSFSVMRKLISRFLHDDSGATAIEYCLIAVGLSIVILAAVNGIGTTLNTNFTSINSSLK
jgi:pilus assembly protein Flp/PilA